jgi:glucose-1-phosphate adenylyltransferase
MVMAGDRVTAYQHTGYWNGLQTAYEYWLAHMDLVRERSALNLQDAAWPIRTQSMVLPPTRVSAGGRMSHSLVCEGCIIDGAVEYSVLSPGVYVAPGAVVRNAVVMHNASIEERAIVENAIVDMNVTVGPHAQVGQVDRHAPTLSPSTLTRLAVVEMDSRIPAHTVVPPDNPEEQWVLSSQRQDVSSTPAEAEA